MGLLVYPGRKGIGDNGPRASVDRYCGSAEVSVSRAWRSARLKKCRIACSRAGRRPTSYIEIIDTSSVSYLPGGKTILYSGPAHAASLADQLLAQGREQMCFAGTGIAEGEHVFHFSSRSAFFRFVR